MKDLDKIRDATCGETKAAIETATQAATYVATCGETKAATCNIIYESSTTTMVAIEESVLDIMENINEN